MKDKIKANLSKVMFELTIVTLGVLIALVINEWFQNYQQRQHAEVLLTKTQFELENNIEALNRTLESYEKIASYLDDLIEKNNYPDDAKYAVSLQHLDVNSSVWEFALQRNALREIPVELLFSIAASYQASQDAQKYAQRMDMASFSEFVRKFKQSNDKQGQIKILKSIISQAIIQMKVASIKFESAAENNDFYLRTGEIKAKKEKQSITIEI